LIDAKEVNLSSGAMSQNARLAVSAALCAGQAFQLLHNQSWPQSAMIRLHQCPPRGAFTLVELVVVIALLGMLLGLMLVAIQASRAVAERIQCASNLRQIGISLHAYHDLHESFPPGAIEPRPLWRNGRQFAWSAMLLPQLELGTVSRQIDFRKPFDHPANSSVAATVLPVFLCPSIPRDSPRRQGRGACDYGGIIGERISGPNQPPKGIMLFDRGIRIWEIRDGASNTLMIAEDSNFPDGQWINGRNVFDQAYAINEAPFYENDIRSLHAKGANGLFADGSVRFLGESMRLEVLSAICTRAGGETVNYP
jgi:prepilin-type N-terminal cleavage/methylation domain-containing protein/prepilin-type processing-associated H-X9-DG protein